ncbi:MAG: polysaccharide deacetylase family protein [Solirubrobacterales bacterium]
MPAIDTYMRRRLVAAGIAAGVLVLFVYLITHALGGSGSVGTAGQSGVTSKPAQPPLEAHPPAGHVKRPIRTNGDGAFMTVSGRTVELRDVSDPGPRVALTFDDGPAPLTPKLLDKLERLDAKASFFVLGMHVAEHPELVRRQAEMGMTIGNHTYDHTILPSLAPGDQRDEMKRAQGMLEEAVGLRPLFFRSPGQSWDFGSARQIAQQGMVGVRFSIDTQDWRNVSSGEIVDSALRAKPGDVIQMHDGGPNREATLRAVGPIVRGLRRRGFQLVTLDELYRPVVQADHRQQGTR